MIITGHVIYYIIAFIYFINLGIYVITVNTEKKQIF